MWHKGSTWHNGHNCNIWHIWHNCTTAHTGQLAPARPSVEVAQCHEHLRVVLCRREPEGVAKGVPRLGQLRGCHGVLRHSLAKLLCCGLGHCPRQARGRKVCAGWLGGRAI
eukprot:1127105-Pyramimonas_sp.AAC.1